MSNISNCCYETDVSNLSVDLDASHYVDNSHLQQDLASELLSQFAFEGNEKVLDIGCGDGRIPSLISQSVPHGTVLGVDASKSMIELAQRKFSTNNLKFITGKAENLDLSEGNFDVIFSFSCFHWVREGNKALTKACKFLQPGGKLVLLTYPAESKYYEFMQRVLERDFPDYASQSAVQTMLSINDYQSILEEAGMTIQTFERKDLLTEEDNYSDIKEFIRGWLTSFVPLPTNLHDIYLDSVIEECKSYATYNENQTVSLPYTELVIIAQK